MDTASSSNKLSLKSVVLDVRAGMAALAASQDANQRTYVASLLRRESVVLAEKCWERHVWLNTSDEWLTAHKDELDPEDLKQRDDRWILAFRQYSAAMDLLGQTLEALKAIPGSAPHPTASSGTAPLTQEAFL